MRRNICIIHLHSASLHVPAVSHCRQAVSFGSTERTDEVLVPLRFRVPHQIRWPTWLSSLKELVTLVNSPFSSFVFQKMGFVSLKPCLTHPSSFT